jgi:hypothetical protein
MTKTTLLPSNQELIEVVKTMDPPPEYGFGAFIFRTEYRRSTRGGRNGGDSGAWRVRLRSAYEE